MRLLLITKYLPPAAGPGIFCTAKLVNALCDAGVRVTTLSCRHPPGRRDSSARWSTLDNINIEVDKPPYFKRRFNDTLGKLRWMDRAASWFSNIGYVRAKHEVSESKYDYVLAGPDLDSLYIAWRLKRECRVSFAARIDDPLPDHLYPPPYGDGQRRWLFQRASEYMARQIFTAADKIIFPSSRLARYELDALRLDDGARSLVLPHIGWKCSTRSDKIAETMNVREIIHAGGVHKERNNEEFYRKLLRLMSSDVWPATLKVVFLGGGPELKAFFEDQGFGCDRVTVEPPQDLESTLVRIGRAEALLLLEAKLIEGIFLPSKFCDYAVSARPLLMFSPETGSVSDKVGGYNHPGFLGQEIPIAIGRINDFINSQKNDKDLARYCCPTPEEYFPSVVAQKLMGYLEG